MVTRSEIVAEARSWIGTPFHHAACVKGVGVDCINLLIGIGHNLGLAPKDYRLPEYRTEPDGRLLPAFEEKMRRVSQDELRPADVVIVAIGDDPQHVGIVSDRNSGLAIIHASNARSCRPPRVIETRLMFSPRFRFVAGYQLPGVT